MTRLTAAEIAEIAKLLDESHFGSLELQMGEFKLRILRDGGGGGFATRDYDEAAPAEAPGSGPGIEPSPPTPPTGSGNAELESAGAGEVDVEAPLLGNFYAAPRPGEPPFVAVGDSVGPDTTIGIIEVMKLMNPIRAGVSGKVVALLAENGKPVEEGQPLLRVKVG